MTERSKQRDLHETVRQALNEHNKNSARATRMFRSLGQRTFRLIRQIGMAEIETSHSMKRFTSEPLNFQLPNYDEEHSLTFSVEKGYDIPFTWGRIIGATACLDTKGGTSPVAIAYYGIDSETYINGISMPANARWLGTHAVQKYEDKVIGFTNLLEVGEALQAGQPVDALLDRLPFFTVDAENTVPVLPSVEGQTWPMLQTPESLPAGKELLAPGD